jgi:hypothetical protein
MPFTSVGSGSHLAEAAGSSGYGGGRNKSSRESRFYVSPGGPPSAEATTEHVANVGVAYQWRGKTYRQKIKKSDVNDQHSLEDIVKYVSLYPPFRYSPAQDVAMETPYQSIYDFVTTMRHSATDDYKEKDPCPFLWPSERLNFMRSVAVALHHLPVGGMVCIKNAREIPEMLFASPFELKPHVLDMYHGSSPMAVPSIMDQGFKPTLGAGCDALEEHFGVPVPGVYLAKSWKVASSYPIYATTGPVPESKSGVGGATCVAIDGTPPLRAVIRCLVDTSNTLWHRGSNQSLFKPSDIFITHVCFYAVHHRLLHYEHKAVSVNSYAVAEGTPIPKPNEGSSYEVETVRQFNRMIAPVATVGDMDLNRAPPQMRLLMGNVSPGESHLAAARKDGLFQQWARKRRSFTRIGSYRDIDEAADISPSLKAVIEPHGDMFITPEGGAAQLAMYIQVEVPYDYVVVNHTPYELEDERARSVAEAMLSGTRTSAEDKLPLARAAPGKEVSATYAGPASTEAGPTPAQPRTASGSQLAEADNAKAAKRRRQKETRDPNKQQDIEKNKAQREYSFYLRAAHASTLVSPVEYYSTYEGMWTPPVSGAPLTERQIEEMRGIIHSNADEKMEIPSNRQAKSRQEIVGRQRQETEGSIRAVSGVHKVGYNPEEDQPMYKVAMYTAAVESFRSAVGSGLAPAPQLEGEEEQQSMSSTGRNLLAKWMSKNSETGETRSDAEIEARVLKMTEDNTPIIDSAVAWKAAARKKVMK